MALQIRVCLGCSKADDHPRHIHGLPDGGEYTLHLDCCALSKNCESCAAQLEGVGGVAGNPKGDALRAHLITCGPTADKPGWTPPDALEQKEG